MGRSLVKGGNWSPLSVCRKGSLTEQVTIVTFSYFKAPSILQLCSCVLLISLGYVAFWSQD